MFSLISSEDSKSEEKYTCLVYETNDEIYKSCVKRLSWCMPKDNSFTKEQWFKYLEDNLTNIKFVKYKDDGYKDDGYAKYELINFYMEKTSDKLTPVKINESIYEMKKEIKNLDSDANKIKDFVNYFESDFEEKFNYPSWNTYEEFKNLKNYKYFEAYEKIESYFEKLYKWGDKFIFRIKKKEAYHANIVMTELLNDKDIFITEELLKKRLSELKIFYNNKGNYSFINYDKERNLKGNDKEYYKLYYENMVNNKVPSHILFSKDVNCLISSYQLTLPFYEYINRFVIGAFLLGECYTDIKIDIMNVDTEVDEASFNFIPTRGILTCDPVHTPKYNILFSNLPFIKKIMYHGSTAYRTDINYSSV